MCGNHRQRTLPKIVNGMGTTRETAGQTTTFQGVPERLGVEAGEKPSLEGYDRVLQLIASDPRISPYTPEWVRSGILAAGEKIRILKYLLDSGSQGHTRALLDIGAQIGAFAMYASRVGFAATGIDYDFFAQRFGQIATEQGVDYRTCDVASEKLPFESDAFDAVTYLDVIEHHSFSPRRVLREAHRVLAPGGKVVISTPNHASIYNRVLLAMGKSINDDFFQFFESAAEFPVYLGHHREYTRAELRRALELTGFNVLECRVLEDDLQSLFFHLRRNFSWHNVMEQRVPLVVRTLGMIWSPLRLPFGRVLWAVGQKPAT